MPVSLRIQSPCKVSLAANPVSPRSKSPREASLPAKPASLRNQYWMQKFFKFLMQKSFFSYWLIFKISCTRSFAPILFCFESKKKIKSDRLTCFYWRILRKFFFSSNTYFWEYWNKFANCDIILFFIVLLF